MTTGVAYKRHSKGFPRWDSAAGSTAAVLGRPLTGAWDNLAGERSSGELTLDPAPNPGFGLIKALEHRMLRSIAATKPGFEKPAAPLLPMHLVRQAHQHGCKLAIG